MTEFDVGGWQAWISEWLLRTKCGRFTMEELTVGLALKEPRRAWVGLSAALRGMGFTSRQEAHAGKRSVCWFRPSMAPATVSADERCKACRNAGATIPSPRGVNLLVGAAREQSVYAGSVAALREQIPEERRAMSGVAAAVRADVLPTSARADGCPSAECEIRSQCTGAAGCPRAPEPPPPPKPEPRVEVVQETITQVEEHRLRAEVRELKAQLKSTVADLSDAQAMLDLKREVDAAPKPAPIAPREKGPAKKREACALVLASDWHIEEEVLPEKVTHRNRYNLEISAQRMTRFFEATRWALDNNRHAFILRDLVMWLGGDLITNYLHDDNKESNLLSPVEAINYAHVNIAEGIRYLLKDPELERIVIPCNDGNHGRLTSKPRAATRRENSIEWLLYVGLAREFKDEPRVQFQIFEGDHVYLDVYERTIRFTHGDSVNYQGGVGGITIPINKAIARWQSVRRADLTCMGHFHQLTSLRDLIINGSLIGYNTFAMRIGAMFEEPAQSFSILDPYRFKSIHVPLWVGSREDDIATRGIA